MVNRKIFSGVLEPVVQPKEYLEFFPSDVLKGKAIGVLVEMVYALPLLRIDLVDSDHLNTNLLTSESAEKEITDDLALDSNQLGQFRLIPESDFKLTYLAQMKARPLWYTKKKSWHLQTILDDPRTNPSVEMLQHNEIFNWEDTDVFFKAQANTSTLTAAYLAVFGYRFICTPVQAFPPGIRPLRIPVTGYPGAQK